MASLVGKIGILSTSNAMRNGIAIGDYLRKIAKLPFSKKYLVLGSLK
jgi:hypothetical protein